MTDPPAPDEAHLAEMSAAWSARRAEEDKRLERGSAGLKEAQIFLAVDRDEGEPVLIAARDVTLDRTHVFYYMREDLEEGQESAFWLK